MKFLIEFLKKLKARGFTLIELLATIALLAIIVVISFVSINAIIKKNKSKQYNNLLSSIEIAAKQYASDNKYSDKFANKKQVSIGLSDLDGYLTLPIIDPYTNSELENPDDVVIIINLDNGAVKTVDITGMPHGGNSHNSYNNNSDDADEDDVYNNGGNSNNNGENNANENGNNNNNENNNENSNAQTYRLTLSCESELTESYGGCKFANDVGLATKTIEVSVGSVVDLSLADTCYCGKGYYYQNAWFYLEENKVLGPENFTMPSHNVTLYAIYE